MLDVAAARYPRNTSFADMCEYSVRKWCSVAHVYLKPTRSAVCTIAVSSMMRRCSSPLNRGNTHALLKSPNSTVDRSFAAYRGVPASIRRETLSGDVDQ